ncbi:putative DUF6 domain protein [Stachybotrys elegans]|uniref:DUF6 domain protein n=1 Tax=Stachybotrys elegans TaxID=80388 RepID=A0A8K0WWH5_9HYPO|nr:putative DUF6 domain protein [Stachybotrys elegans]
MASALRGALGSPTRDHDGASASPLLSKPSLERGRQSYDDDQLSASGRSDSHMAHPPSFNQRRSNLRSRSPKEMAAAAAARKKYTYAGFFLVVSLITFCVQTELSAHVQHDLGWDKAYCMMYLTHGSWFILWPALLLFLRFQKRDVPWSVFWQRHKNLLWTTAIMVETRSLDVSKPAVQSRAQPLRYMARFTAIITTSLTVAGLSWYIAVSMTTPSDLTAIYNCSAFFAYVFSVPLLKEPLRFDKSLAVLIAIAGVLVVAYGDVDENEAAADVTDRFFGNIIIGIGSVLYGLYEVLYKRFACPPDGVSPDRGMIFAILFGACIGTFTLTVLWIPLPILHILDIERFVIPSAWTCWLILAAVLSNAIFSGSFLVLISLTSPVLSSVAALLTIFLVAIVDWMRTGKPLSAAAIIGGTMIIAAFLGLSLSTYRELKEHEARKMAVDFSDSDRGDSDED